MEHYAGIDVSLELSSVCIVDAKGKIVREAKVASDPDTLVAFFKQLGFPVVRIGLEAGPLSQWLCAGLAQAGFETILLETRHVKAALSAMTVKTDRKDARGIAQLIRMGWFRPVHCKSPGSQEVRALLVARELLLGKLLDVELSIRGILRGFGLKMGVVTRKTFEARARELSAGQMMLETVVGAMLTARAALQSEYAKLHKTMLVIVRDDKICRRLMKVPRVGPVVAITFKTAVDDPTRISKSKAVGPLVGLTPKKYQSGETDVTGGITCGYDLPAAIGAFKASEGAPIVCLAGDGSIMMNLQEVQTIVGARMPIKIFLLNNGGYVSIFQTHRNFFNGVEVGAGPGSGVSFPDFERLMAGFGLPYRRVTRHDDMAEAIRAVMTVDGPAVCEVMIDQNQPFAPKLASRQLPDGAMVSPSLEDMAPFLSREELARNMIVD
jgi:transposase